MTEEFKVPDDVTQIEKPVKEITDEQWTAIIQMLTTDNDKPVEIDASNMSKEERFQIHTAIKKVLREKIVASTIDKDNKKLIEIKKFTGGTFSN